MSHLPFNSKSLFQGQAIVLLLLFSVPFIQAQKVGINTETPTAGLHVISNDGLLISGEYGAGGLQADGAGTRLMFTPKFGSFRVGRLTNNDGGAYENWWSAVNTGDYSFVSGVDSKASGFASFATGYLNQANSEGAFVAGGRSNIASGVRSFVTGYNNTAFSFGETVIGLHALEYTPASVNSFETGDRLFVVGNGASSSSRSNALTILKNGNVGVGTASPSSTLHVLGNQIIDDGSLFFENTGESIFIGKDAGATEDHNNRHNILIGYRAGKLITSGQHNIAIGSFTLANAVSNQRNTAIGYASMSAQITGDENVAVGFEAMKDITSGYGNVSMGFWAMYLNTTGYHNTAIGNAALRNNFTGFKNVAIGNSAMYGSYGDEGNVAVGNNAGNAVDGNYNTIIGYNAGFNLTGSYNVLLGNESGSNETGDHKLYIDNSNTSTPLIYGDFATNKVTINDSLASKHLQITQGATSGHVLVSDATGRGSWTDPQLLSSSYWSSNAGKIFRNSNVGINTNNPLSALHTVGDIKIETGRLLFELTNESVLIGTDAGLSNAGSGNVFIGEVSGYANTSGSNNIGLGPSTLFNNISGGDNIAIGRNALFDNSTGSGNIALGDFALTANTTKSSNIGIGANSLGMNVTGESNIGIGFMTGFNVQGNQNTLIGHEAGHETTGSGNVMLGYHAGYSETGSNKLYIDNSNTSSPLMYGDFGTNHLTINDSLTTKMYKVNGGRIEFENTGNSVFIGEEAGKDDDLSTNNNVFIGHKAGKANITGANNIAIGSNALDNASNTFYNIALGQDVLGNANLTGNNNTGIGNFSLNSNTTGNENTAIGQSALGQNTSGLRNVSIGNYSSDAITTGSYNTVLGYEALGENLSGEANVALGYYAGHNATGNQNTFLGVNAGLLNTSGTGNIFLGNEAGFNETGSNKLYIDNSGSTSPLIHGDFSINKVTINDSLATKYFQLTNGALNNYVLKSDNIGRGSWSEPSLLFHNTTSNNLFIGDEVGDMVTTAVDNTIVGAYAGSDLTTGYENTGLGFWSLLNITTGTFNTAIGHNTLSTNVTGSNNTALGWSALAGTTGVSNTGIGAGAGGENTSGSRNVYMGHESGFNNQGSDNVFLGYRSGKNESGSNKLYIENSDNTSPLIYGDFSTNEVTINDSLTVNKELGVATSTPASTFEVNGSVAAKFKTPLVAGTTNPDDTGMVWRYSSGTGTITLPGAGTCPNRMYVIINQTGAARTISTFRNLTTSNQTTIGSSVALWLMSDGTEWWQIK